MDELKQDKTKPVDILAEMRAFKKECESADGHNRYAAVDDLQFLEGEGQWPDGIKAAREADGRPCLTINKLPQYVAQVANDMRQNRPSIKVRPVDSQTDPAKAALLEGLIRNIEYVSKADQAYDTAGFYAVACGMGFITVETCYADDDGFDQDIRICRVRNPMTVFIDPHAKEADASDMTRAMVTSLMAKEAFKKKYPNAAATSALDGNEWGDWYTSDSVRIAEYWTREQVTRRVALLPDGSVVEVENVPEGVMPVSTRNALRWKVKYRLCTGSEILEEKEWPGKYIPIVPVWGEEIDINGKVFRRGLIRNAKDSQRMYNYWRTTATELIALAPKAPVLLTDKQIDGKEGEWETANVTPRPYLTYNADSQAPAPQRLEPASVPQGVFTEAQVCVDDMKSTTGIYDASLGARGNETSGRAIMMRQREGDNATFVYTDNLSRAIAQVGRIVCDLIPKIYDTQRIVRVLGEDGTQEIVPVNMATPGGLLNDLSTGKYDIVVESGPSYATKRMEAAETMMQFVQAQPGLAPIIGDLIAKNMDWPGADKIAARLQAMLPDPIKSLEQDGEQNIPPQLKAMIEQGMAQMEQMAGDLQKLQAENAKLKAERETKERELAIKEYDAETKRLQVTSVAMTPEQVQAITAQTVVELLTPMQETAEAPEMPEMGEMPEMDEGPAEPMEPVGLMPPSEDEGPAAPA